MRPWHTKAWRKRREEILKTRDKCEWCGSNKILTMDHITPPNLLTEEEYLAIRDEDILVLCRKCAGARLHGLNLCPECKKHYKKRGYEKCWDCFSKTDEGKEWIENRAILVSEEEVPLIDVELPCMETIKVYEDQYEYGGMLEVCGHQCPLDTEPNSCEIYKKYRMEEEKELMNLEAQFKDPDTSTVSL